MEKKEKEILKNAFGAWRVFVNRYKKLKVGDLIGFSVKRKHFIIKRDN